MFEFDVSRVSLYLFFLLVVATLSFIPVLVLVYLRDRSKSRYDADRKEMSLSAMRNNYEREISELSRRLTATEERWQEINHLILTSQSIQPEVSRPISPEHVPLLQEMAISNAEALVQDDLVFVITPFADSEDATFKTIRHACEPLKLRCVRGDEDYIEGDVLPHIVRLICQARIVVANVGSRNPNVFYELGIAHTLGKTTVLVGQTIEEVPFDIRTKRVVTYSKLFDLENRLRLVLGQALGIYDTAAKKVSK